MDQEILHIKQLALGIFEKIILKQEYASKDEIMLVAVTMSKEVRKKNMPEKIIKAQDEALKMLQGLSFEEIKEIKEILKDSDK